MERAAEPLNRGFFARMRRGVPWVRSKLAVSLDGRTALANGTSQWITSADARADVHRWRARSSAVLTGSGTIVDDDPSLDARREEARHRGELGIKQPLRVDHRCARSRRRRPPRRCRCRARCSCSRRARSTIRRPRALRAAGARVERVAGNAEHCDLARRARATRGARDQRRLGRSGRGLERRVAASGAHRRTHYLYGAAVARRFGARHVRACRALESLADELERRVRRFSQGRRRLADHGPRQ